MSFGALPTELDATIINHLAHGDLIRLSCVSKYYRKLAETLLYDNIQLHTHDHNRIKRLLLTLLHRRGLRPLIHRLGVHHERGSANLKETHVINQIILPVDLGDTGLYEALVAHASSIDAVLSKLAALYGFHPQFKRAMFAKIFEPYPLYDGALALILCMMTKVTFLELELTSREPLAMTRHLLKPTSWHWTGPNHVVQHLTFLRLRGIGEAGEEYRGAYEVVVYPTTEILEIFGNTCEPRHWHAEFLTTKTPAVLKSLTLSNINIDPDLLEKIVKSPYCRNLESLSVLGIGAWLRGEDLWEGYDYAHLKTIMQEYLPNLQYFTWLEMVNLESSKSFVSFGKFRKLKELKVDNHLFSKHLGEDDRNKLPSQILLPEYYPINLELLELGCWSWDAICMLPIAYGSDEGTVQDKLSSLAGLVASLPMKEIRLPVDLNGKSFRFTANRTEMILDGGGVNMLRTLADVLESHGTKFSVYYHIGLDDKPARMLIAPGVTAKMLYDKDNVECWRAYPGAHTKDFGYLTSYFMDEDMGDDTSGSDDGHEEEESEDMYEEHENQHMLEGDLSTAEDEV